MKVMIVDDEKNTRESLQQFVPWAEIGVDQVVTARNGKDALAQIGETEPPDILLTDVRMPKMDGIQLAASLRDLHPECKIIFLSGYADKEYLMQAIHLGAISYIEKPISVEEIHEVIMKAVSACRREALAHAERSKWKAGLNESIPLVRQQIALEWIKPHSDADLLASRLGHVFVSLSPDNIYFAVHARMNWKPGASAAVKDEIKQSLLDLFSSESGIAGFTDCLAGFNAEDHLVLILIRQGERSAAVSDPELRQLLEQLAERSTGAYTVTLGIGEQTTDRMQIPVSWKQAEAASRRQFFLGTGRIIRSGPVGRPPFEPDPAVLEQFRAHLENDCKDGAQDVVRSLTEAYGVDRDDDPSTVKEWFLQLIQILSAGVRDRGINLPLLPHDSRKLWHQVDAYVTLEELSGFVCSTVEAFFVEIENRDSNNRSIYEIKSYIKENYTNPELTTHSIAVHVNLSQSYLCAFFKKSTGQTLNAYMTEIRMEKAKDLLKENKLKLYEIAGHLGYTDANYFSTLFKRYTGFTPTQYREKHYHVQH